MLNIYLKVTTDRHVIKENTAPVVAAPQKQSFIAIVYDSKSHTKLFWHVISIKLNIGKKVTGLEKMALNHKKI